MLPTSSLEALAPALPLAGLAAHSLARWIAERRRPPRVIAGQTQLAPHLPWTKPLPDGVTVRTQAGTYFRVFELAGASYSGLTDSQKSALLHARLDWLRGMRTVPVHLRFFFSRHHLALPVPPTGTGFLGDVDRAWNKHLADVYTTSHHIIVSVTGSGNLANLEHAAETIQHELHAYGPSAVRLDQAAIVSPLVSYLSELVGGYQTPLAPATDNLNWATGYHDVRWTADGQGYTSDGLSRRHWAVFSVRDLPDYASIALAELMATLPGEVTLYVHAEPLSPVKTQGAIRYRSKQEGIFAGHFGNDIVAAEWKDTANEIAAGQNALYTAEIAIIVMAESDDRLRDLIAAVRATLTTQFNKLALETAFAQDWYFGRFPDRDYFIRPWTLRASNLALWLPFSAEARGITRCDWGPTPHRYIPTAGSKSPFGFTFHESGDDQANPMFAIYGGAGTGKTTAITNIFMGCLSAYPDFRGFMFDQKNGLRVITAALEGEYLMPGTATLPLAPFDTDDSPEARAILERFLAILVGAQNDRELKVIAKAVAKVMDDPREKRRLGDTFLNGYCETGRVREALEKWIRSERFGHVFTGTQDAFNPNASRLVTIDMTLLREDPVLAAACTYYFMSRIRQVVGARKVPHGIFVDEAGTLLQIPAFANQIEEEVRTTRKNHGSIGFAFQELGALLNCTIHKSLLINIKTHLLYRGCASTAEECHAIGLVGKEIDWALGHAPLPAGASRHTAMLKRDDITAYLDFNMNPLGNLVRVFAGGTGPVERMMECKKLHGPDWLRHFVNWA